MRTVSRLGVVGLSVALFAGCGGSEPDGGGTATTLSNEGAASPSPGETDSGNYATVTVGGITYEVPPDPLNTCNSLDNLIFGSFAVDDGGQATAAGGPDAAVQINFALPSPDWEAQGLQPPTIIVDDNESGARRIASIEADAGSVDSWDLVDGRASGTATFAVQQTGSGAEPVSETGSFEMVCQ